MSPRAAVALMACFSLVTPPTLAVNVLSIVARRVLGLNDDSYSQASVSGEAMLVVGAGFGRTGTESLCAALSQLGFKTYHGSKALRHAHLPLWNNYFASLTSESPDSSVFDALENEGFNATTDFPASLAFETMLLRNPAAKVVLSLHPRGPQGWAQSYLKVLVPLGKTLKRPPFSLLKPFQEFTKTAAYMQLVTDIEVAPATGQPTAETLERAYTAWIAKVEAAVPQNQLLLHTATDGYAPLAKFLALTAPPEPYPNVNDSTELLQQVLVLQAVADWWPFVWPLCLLALLGLVVKQIWMKHLWRSNSSDDKKKR